MHPESMDLMKYFVDKYLKETTPLRVLDVGSQAVKVQSLSYKKLMKSKWKYEGLDIEAGMNVDIVVKDPYNWINITDETYDVVISGQALEHVKYPWLTMKEIDRVLKKDGLACIIVPSMGFEHRFPVDCYRYLPDGLRALGEYVNLEILECFRNNYAPWRDCILIGKKK